MSDGVWIAPVSHGGKAIDCHSSTVDTAAITVPTTPATAHVVRSSSGRQANPATTGAASQVGTTTIQPKDARSSGPTTTSRSLIHHSRYARPATASGAATPITSRCERVGRGGAGGVMVGRGELPVGGVGRGTPAARGASG